MTGELSGLAWWEKALILMAGNGGVIEPLVGDGFIGSG